MIMVKNKKQTKYNNFFKKKFYGISIGFCLGIITILSVLLIKKNTQPDSQEIEPYKSEYIHRLESQYSITRDSLANEIDRFIKKSAPTSVIDPFLVVDLCDEYDVDIKFVLAQGFVESHFATKGAAAKTNSVFNVGAFDGHSTDKQISNGYGYKHPNQSIEPYLKLLKNNYLVNGRTEQDLLENFVNANGKRYASNNNYEAMLKKTITSIQKSTKIEQLSDKYRMYKLKLGWE